MSTKNARTLSIRLDTTDAADLADFEQRTGIDGVTLGRNAIRACIAYFKAGGSIAFPLHLTPKSETVPAYLREEETHYPTSGSKKKAS
jgi:hypothetical protein